MSKLIALVATAVLVDGVRTVIQPGEPLPELSAHDERELLQAAADAEFEATRQQVQQAQASTATAEDGKDAAPAAPAKAASKTPARK